MTDSQFAASAAVAILGLSFLVLGSYTVAFLVRRFIIIPRVRRDFLELHRRRVARARRALAAQDATGDGGPASPICAKDYSFSAWLGLGEGGTVTIAGQTFRPGDSFAVTALDANNIPRVKAAATRQEVFIYSHGQNYRAKFTGTEWEVKLVGEGQL
jgi:hypothetical protein